MKNSKRVACISLAVKLLRRPCCTLLPKKLSACLYVISFSDTALYCPLSFLGIMNYAAFLVFKVCAEHFPRVPLLLSPLSQICLLSSLNLLHTRRMCYMDWLPLCRIGMWVRWSLPCSLERIYCMPIFPVRICTMAELTGVCREEWSQRNSKQDVLGRCQCIGHSTYGLFFPFASCAWMYRYSSILLLLKVFL